MATKTKRRTKDEGFVSVTIRWPEDVHADALRHADSEERSFNQWIVRAVKAQLAVLPEPGVPAVPRKAAAR